MVEPRFCKPEVVGSNPTASLLNHSSLNGANGQTRDLRMSNTGQVPKWLKGTDCKSVGDAFGGSNPSLPTLETLSNEGVLEFLMSRPVFAGAGHKSQ